MSFEEITYSLKELSAAAEVSPRTIRYYVKQGVLPPAARTGPGVRYSHAYLLRLKLIRRLQDDHLPLAQIRKRLKLLDDDELQAVLDALEPQSSSAAVYVRELLNREPMGDASAGPPSRALASRAMASPPSGPAYESSRGIGRKPRGWERSQWDRMVLDEDIELHIRRPLSRSKNRRLSQLIDAARQIFEEEK